MLSRHLNIVLLVAVAVAGCGGLRRLPIRGSDGGPGGVGGGSGDGSAGNDGSVFNPDAITDAPMCVPGGDCVPANVCHKGTFVCQSAGRSCMELTDTQANGTVCGTDKVCHNGSCDSCVADMACDPTGKPCRVGHIVCTTGAPVCTEIDNKPNGMSCGNGMVCQAGNCATCQMGGACTPTNKCHTGSLVCSGASPTCNDTGSNVAAGAACGTDMVCNAGGSCVACVSGMDCTVAGKPCRKGTIACNTGTPICIESSDAPNGTACGANMVCSGGNCSMCTAGSACVPANPCHGGITVCSPAIACTDTGNALTNGVSCGTDRVCNGGACVACAMGSSCQLANPCKTGMTSCATGSPVCAESGNQPNGTNCGTGMVCSAGSCMACSSGTACAPTNPCHTGSLNCSTGTPTCTDSGSNQPNGTGCGMNLVCNGGSCVSCTAGQACQPTNPCKNGMVVCTTGVPVCTETTNKGQGTLCGAGQSCTGGVLTLPAMCNAAGMCTAATMACMNGTCNASGTDCATCPNGQTSCPTGCKDLTRDAANCGTCGNVCPPPDIGSGIPICVSSSCHVQCDAGYFQCLPVTVNMCQQQVWDFEDRHDGGFMVINSPSAAGKIAATSKQAHSGFFSLGVEIMATDRARGFQVGQPVCAGKGFIPGKSMWVSAWMYLEPIGTPPTLGKASYWGIRVKTDVGETLAKGAPRGYNDWFPVTVMVPDGEQLQAFDIEGVFQPDLLGGDWTGMVYIDDVTISQM